MPLRNTAEAYGSFSKFLHWAIVLLILPQYFLVEAAEELPKGLERLQLMTWHKSLGMLVLLLALVRIAWKVMNQGRPGSLVAVEWQRKAAAAGHGLLYVLILAQPITGWIASSSGNYPVTLFNWFQFPAIVGENHDLHELMEEVHEFLFFTLLAVAAIHVAAALYHHFMLKDGVLRRMLPFAKP
jgi:cytochrome b561